MKKSLPPQGEVPAVLGAPRNHGAASDFVGIKAGMGGRPLRHRLWV